MAKNTSPKGHAGERGAVGIQRVEKGRSAEPYPACHGIERETSDALRDVGDDGRCARALRAHLGDLLIARHPDRLAQLVHDEVPRLPLQHGIEQALFDELPLAVEAPELALAQHPELLVQPDAKAPDLGRRRERGEQAGGVGVEKSDEKALEWLRKSADQGLPEAEYLLSAIYSTGQYGVPRDDKLATRWLRRTAAQGYADAEFPLGLAYAEGRGVKKEPKEAYGWTLRASRRGHAPAIAHVKDIQSQLEKKRQPRE